jgi:hypothetical protein
VYSFRTQWRFRAISGAALRFAGRLIGISQQIFVENKRVIIFTEAPPLYPVNGGYEFSRTSPFFAGQRGALPEGRSQPSAPWTTSPCRADLNHQMKRDYLLDKVWEYTTQCAVVTGQRGLW